MEHTEEKEVSSKKKDKKKNDEKKSKNQDSLSSSPYVSSPKPKNRDSMSSTSTQEYQQYPQYPQYDDDNVSLSLASVRSGPEHNQHYQPYPQIQQFPQYEDDKRSHASYVSYVSSVHMDQAQPAAQSLPETKDAISYINTYFVVGVLLTCVGCTLHAVGIATPHWSSAHLTNEKGQEISLNYAIWRTCELYQSGYVTCDVHDHIFSSEDTAKVLAIFGVVFSACAILSSLITIMVTRDTMVERFRKIAAECAALGAMFNLICVVTWVIFVHPSQSELSKKYPKLQAGTEIQIGIGYSIILSSVSCFVLLVGCLFIQQPFCVFKPK